MSMHQDLVEEVYNNVSFRSEFVSYAKLSFTLKLEQQSRQKASAAPNPEGDNFISYNDLITIKIKIETDSLAIIKSKEGISFLYSSLARALSKVYRLDDEETRQLIFAVADRYSQSL